MAIIQQELTAPAPAAVDAAFHRPGTRRLGLWLAAAGWSSLGLMWATGSAELFGHDQRGMPAPFAIGLFLAGWLAMVAAMMLPSSLRALGLVDQQLDERVNAPRFMVGFFSTWTAFGAAAFAGDGLLHVVVDNSSWLSQRPSLIAGGVAMLAGAAEMLGRTPPPLLPRVSPEDRALDAGVTHAIDRIRRCWPLMLFAMAVGMSSPGWMVGLTLVMALELRPRASATLRAIGFAVFALGVAVIVEPSWLPVLVGS